MRWYWNMHLKSLKCVNFGKNPFALRSKKCCRTGSNCVQTEWTWWQLFALCVRTFLNVMNGLEREGCLRTSTLLKILRTPSRSEIGRTDIVLKTTWTNFERNCRTSNLLWTLCNVVQTGINWSTCSHFLDFLICGLLIFFLWPLLILTHGPLTAQQMHSTEPEMRLSPFPE